MMLGRMHDADASLARFDIYFIFQELVWENGDQVDTKLRRLVQVWGYWTLDLKTHICMNEIGESENYVPDPLCSIPIFCQFSLSNQ